MISTTEDDEDDEQELRDERGAPRFAWARRAAPLPLHRRVAGLVVAAVGLPLLTAVLTPLRDSLSLTTDSPALPRPHGGRGRPGRGGGGRAGGGRRIAAGELVPRAPLWNAHHQRSRELRGLGRLRRRRGHDGLLRRPDCGPLTRGSSRPDGGGGAGPHHRRPPGREGPGLPAGGADPRLVLPGRRVAAQPIRRHLEGAGRQWRGRAHHAVRQRHVGLPSRSGDAARRPWCSVEQRRPAGAADVRLPAGAGAREPAVAGRGGRGRLVGRHGLPCGPRSSRPSPTTCGHRWRRSRPRPRACCRTTSPGATRSAPSSSPPSTRSRTVWTPWWGTCST